MGLDLGLERTGAFSLKACVEVEPAFCATIRLNRDEGRLRDRGLRVYESDICDLDPSDVLRDVGLAPGELDLLIGGPPCQSFSTAGRRRTVRDARGTLLWQFLRFVEVMRPKFFLLENVRGLLSAAVRHRPIKDRPDHGGPPLAPDEEPGSVMRLFAQDLAQIPGTPYRIDCFEVNAVNYGAPQLRERVLLFGNRFNRQVDFPAPTHGSRSSTVQQLKLGDGKNEHQIQPFRSLRDVIYGLQEANPVVLDFSPRKKRYLAMVPPGSNWRALPEEIQRESMGKAWHAKGGRSGWWRRLSWDLPAPTIVTMPNHAGTALCHPDQVRALTVRESSLIQEFPPDWEFVGTPSEQYVQVGNAVPTRLGTVAGQILGEHLTDLQNGSNTPSARVREPFRIVYVQSHVRTRQWFKKGQTFIWQDGSGNREAEYPEPVTLTRVRRL